MKLLSTVLLISCFFISNQGHAQKYTSFDFNENPTTKVADSILKQEDILNLNKFISVEYFYNEESQQTEQYTFSHNLIWINSDKAIKNNNKIYLSSGENSSYLYQKARVIKPNGQIVELKESDIKEGYYEENETTYQYYAIEGLEKGSFIETANYKKSSPNFYGSIIYFQSDIKRREQLFELICPSFLEFSFKSMNYDSTIKYDSSYQDGNRWYMEIENTEPISDQPTIFKNNLQSGIIYKLDRNTSNNLSDITSYGSASQNVFNNLHPEISKKTKKELTSIYKDLKIKKLKTVTEKIKAIENYLKTTFQTIDNSYHELSKIEFILENKSANSTGITKIFIHLLELAEIGYEIVLTTDRSSIKFDPDFEAYLFLNNYLLYFPKPNFYLAPSEQFFRAPYVPALWTANYGLFIKEVSLGEVKTAVGKVKFIKPLPYDSSKDEMEINVDFSKELTQAEVSFKRSLTGYSAQFLQPFIHLLDEKELSDIDQTLVEMISEDMEAKKVKKVNIGKNDFGSKPFIYQFTTNEHAFIEKAGNDLIFKIGELIGSQVEMYLEEKRLYDVESDHNRYYKRTITFNVPDGYKIKNTEKLNYSYKYGKSGSEDLYFDSRIEKDGNQYQVRCIEFYAVIHYPKADFENYQKVINAAADFNKLVLVLEKIN